MKKFLSASAPLVFVSILSLLSFFLVIFSTCSYLNLMYYSYFCIVLVTSHGVSVSVSDFILQLLHVDISW
jgi:hypothetical protein